ncbi:MAG: choline dehydrogenase [Gemmobacter sp.]|nr:choline dehydrogenase [Gemmobacter sp.]
MFYTETLLASVPEMAIGWLDRITAGTRHARRSTDPAAFHRSNESLLPMTVSTQEFDYVIVGAGSAGCVLAARLTEDPEIRVLLLEAGGPDRSLMMQIPAGVYKVYHNPAFNWNYESEPQAALAGRRIPVPRGRTLGGSSSINSMVWLRGHPADYDAWAEQGLVDWSFAHCLPYFRKSETSDRGASDYRGGDGPVQASRGRLASPIFDAFEASASAAGHRLIEDLNGPDAVGIGRLDCSKGGGRRCSAAVAYLHPALSRPNLTVLTRALAHRVLIEAGRAVGLRYGHAGQTHTTYARREVILSGGAINTPQLLMLSGIGPADDLRRHGIHVTLDQPGIGGNLQDHIDLGMSFRCTEPVSHAWMGSRTGKLRVGLEWLLRQTGPGASNIWEIGGFARAMPDSALPTVHYHLAPMKIDARPDGSFGLSHGFTLHLSQLRQRSRGRLSLRSAAPTDAPCIDFRFFSDPRDIVEMREGIKVTREIVGQTPLARLGTMEVVPGVQAKTDAEIEAALREGVRTEFHPSCTCRMGVDAAAVVDPELRLNGIDGLRAVDASVMPHVVGANLNATVIMIAEKAADMIRGRPALPPAAVTRQPAALLREILSPTG